MTAVGDDAEPATNDTTRTTEEQPGGSNTALWWAVALGGCACVASLLQVFLQVSTRGLFLVTFAFMVAVGAAWVDCATRRIPNALTYPAIAIGLVVHVLVLPLEALGLDTAVLWLGADLVVFADASSVARAMMLDGMYGFSLCAAIGIVSFIARGLGGGDVKLLGAMGAILGFKLVVPVLFNTLLVAAVIGLVNLALRGGLVAKAQVLAFNLLTRVVTRDGAAKLYPFKKTESPFGVSVLGGLIIAQFLPLYTLVL